MFSDDKAPDREAGCCLFVTHQSGYMSASWNINLDAEVERISNEISALALASVLHSARRMACEACSPVSGMLGPAWLASMPCLNL